MSVSAVGTGVQLDAELVQRLRSVAERSAVAANPGFGGENGVNVELFTTSRERKAAEAALSSHPLYPALCAALLNGPTTDRMASSEKRADESACIEAVNTNLTIWQQKLGQLDQALRKEGIDPTDPTANVVVPVTGPIPESSDTAVIYHQQLTEVAAVYHRLMTDYQQVQETFMSHVASILRYHSTVLPVAEANQELSVQQIHTRLLQPLVTVKEECLQCVAEVRASLLTERQSKRHRSHFSNGTLVLLNEFFYANINNPYPTESTKTELADKCNMTLLQVSNWFSNKRIRFKKTVRSELAPNGTTVIGHSGDGGEDARDDRSPPCPYGGDGERSSDGDGESNLSTDNTDDEEGGDSDYDDNHEELGASQHDNVVTNSSVVAIHTRSVTQSLQSGGVEAEELCCVTAPGADPAEECSSLSESAESERCRGAPLRKRARKN